MDSFEADTDFITPFNITIVRPDEFDPQNWPVQPGDYQVFNARKSVAVVFLDGVNIDEMRLHKLSKSITIAGSLTTENLGVEHIIKNIIANPFIRHLIIFGNEIDGHCPGDAIVKLAANGVNEKQKIVDACGARPVLKNVAHSEIEHFNKQVRVHNLIEKVDLSLLINALEKIEQLEKQPYEAGLKVDMVEIIKAKPAKRLKLDPAGYFVILVMKGKKHPLIVEHYSNGGRLRRAIKGEDAATICATLIDMGLVSQIDHAAYLGRELAKAEMSLRIDVKYIQDRAQADVECQPEILSLTNPSCCRGVNSKNKRIC